MAKNGFLLNVTALIGSNIISQVLAVIASVVEARLYSPLEMGVYSTYIAMLVVLSVVICFQYERAIILTKDDQEAKELIWICFSIAALLSIIAFFIIVSFSDHICFALNVPQLVVWIKFLPFSILISGILLIMTYWNIKNSNMKLIAFVNIITVMSVNFSQIIFGIERFHLAGGMIIGHLLGNAIAVLLYIRYAGKEIFQRCKLNIQLLDRFKKFPLFSVPSTFFDTFGANSPNLLLANFFGATVTGFYALGYRLLSIPVSVLSQALGQAFLPKAVDAKQNNALANATSSVFEYMLKLALVPLLLMAFTAKPLISIIFGPVWLPTADFIPWLCFWFFFGLMYSPISGVLIVLERQRDGLIINIATLFIKIISLCLGGIYGNAFLAVVLCSVFSGFASLAACFYIMYLVNIDFICIAKLIIKHLLRTVVFVFPMIIVTILGCNYFEQLAVAVLNGCIFLAVSGRELLPLLRGK